MSIRFALPARAPAADLLVRPRTTTRGSLVAAVLGGVLFGAPAIAQDKITWVDGTVTDDAKVTGFNLREIKYSVKGGGAQTKPTDQVDELSVRQVQDTYRRAFSEKDGGAAMFVDLAKPLVKKDAFLAQFGYFEAARVLLGNGQVSEALGVLEDLVKELPDSGFVPELYRTKLDYYLSQGKEGAQSAAKVAKDYVTATNTMGMTDGFVHEAAYYQIMTDAVGGQINAAEMERRLRTLLATVEGVHAKVANRARLALANSLRAQKKTPEAGSIYAELLAGGTLNKTLLAQAWMGMGYIKLEQGDASNKEPFKEASLNFLHVYLDTPEAPDEVVAEALYNAKVGFEKWGGLDAGLMSKRLEYILRKNPRFAGTDWAKR